MNKIGIFFGSDTGNTEKVSKLIRKYMLPLDVKLHDVIDTSKSQIEQYDFLIFGIPTWYYGELQCDWDDFLPILKTISFKNKIVAFFGCGDQEDYSEYFCDAINEIYQIVKNNNGIVIGKWPNKEYNFQQSKALLDKNYFIGLIIDEDRQKEKTDKRIKCWIKQLKKEANKILLKNNVEHLKKCN